MGFLCLFAKIFINFNKYLCNFLGKTLLQLKTYGKSGKSQLDGNLKHGRATINNRVNIHLISSLELVPKMTSLFNHPTNVAKIHLKDGSNFFKVETYPDEIALIQYLKNERLLEVRPLKTGKLTIKVSDLCLSPIDSVLTAEVNIVAIDHIELFGQQYVQLGRKVEIVAKLFDKNNDVIFIPSLESVQLKILIDNDVASVNIVENKLPVLSHINFEVIFSSNTLSVNITLNLKQSYHRYTKNFVLFSLKKGNCKFFIDF